MAPVEPVVVTPLGPKVFGEVPLVRLAFGVVASVPVPGAPTVVPTPVPVVLAPEVPVAAPVFVPLLMFVPVPVFAFGPTPVPVPVREVVEVGVPEVALPERVLVPRPSFAVEVPLAGRAPVAEGVPLVLPGVLAPVLVPVPPVRPALVPAPLPPVVPPLEPPLVPPVPPVPVPADCA
jgi:hypothetical protein